MKVLITGADGQLGRELTGRFPTAVAMDRDQLDITDEAALAAFDWSSVDTIVNAAGYTAVDAAQTVEGRRAAWAVNAQAVASLAYLATQHNLTLVHVSSETVFDGMKASPYTEEDPVAPLGVYAQTKAAGDMAAGVTTRHYIVRPSWLVGDGANFVRTMTDLARRNVSPRVVEDQIGRLTFTSTVVDGIEALLTQKAAYGVYNLSNDGPAVSWAEVSRMIWRELGRDDLTVTGVSTEEYFRDKPEAAPRPLQGVLDLSKIKAAGVALTDWRDELAAYIKAESKRKGAL